MTEIVSIDSAAALEILVREGGYFHENVWSLQLQGAEAVLRQLIERGIDCGARLHNDRVVLIPKVGMGVTMRGYTDREPYEIVRVINLSTVDIRPMHAILDPAWVPDVRRDGFSGTVVNQADQRWTLSSLPEAKTIRIRLMKQGHWHHPDLGVFWIGFAAKFHDYNF